MAWLVQPLYNLLDMSMLTWNVLKLKLISSLCCLWLVENHHSNIGWGWVSIFLGGTGL